jgi:hypothetical protein
MDQVRQKNVIATTGSFGGMSASATWHCNCKMLFEPTAAMVMQRHACILMLANAYVCHSYMWALSINAVYERGAGD